MSAPESRATGRSMRDPGRGDSLAPIAFAVRDELRKRWGHGDGLDRVRVSVNTWEGHDFRSISGATLVRVAVDDNTVTVYRFTGRAEMLQSKATFTWTTAPIIALIVDAFLALEWGES